MIIIYFLQLNWSEFEIQARHIMKLKVPLRLPSESVIYFYPSSAVFYKDYNEQCPLTKCEQFSKSSFR